MVAKSVRILFTSVGRRVELVQQFRAAAADLGIKLEIIGADISESAPALTCCDHTLIVPRIKDSAYIPALVNFCQEQHVDALIPTIDTDLYLLSCEKQRFAETGTTVFISAPDKIAICRDKRFTADYFHSIGLSSPSPTDDVACYNGGFPAFIKPLDGSSSIGANKANTPEELSFFASRLSGYVIQPFVSGTEYTVDIFCDTAGNPIYITPRIRQAVRAGEVLKTKIHHEPSIVEECLRLVQDFKPCGGITVQLIRNEETGINQYIEINPRFGGGAPLSMKAGADAAKATLQTLMGRQLTYQSEAASEGAVYSRFDQSVCVSREKAAPVQAVVFDLDDTLYSEKEYVRSGYRHIANLLPQVENAEEKLWDAFRNGKAAIDYVLSCEGIYSEELKAKCLQAYRHQIPDIHLYDGIRELLTDLRNAGIQIGIITDGRPEGQRAKIKALGLEALVDSILITDELGGPQFRKPNDMAFRIMQMRLGIPFASMVYVGDNAEKDFQAPKMLGMQWVQFCNEDGLYYHAGNENGPSASTVAEINDILSAII